jgi:DNA-binding MarR family transcriptional regulator
MGPMGRFAARFRLLEALASASAPLSVSELAERIAVDQPRASRLVQATVEAGHARREADENDARRTNILITDEGRALVSQARGARVGAVETALSGFTPDERAQLAALLERLAQAWPRE